MALSFEQFQASKRECDDLAAAIDCDFGVDHKVTGLLYMGSLFIQRTSKLDPVDITDEGDFILTIYRDQWVSSDLESLERQLYDFAVSEGYEA